VASDRSPNARDTRRTHEPRARGRCPPRPRIPLLAALSSSSDAPALRSRRNRNGRQQETETSPATVDPMSRDVYNLRTSCRPYDVKISLPASMSRAHERPVHDYHIAPRRHDALSRALSRSITVASEASALAYHKAYVHTA